MPKTAPESYESAKDRYEHVVCRKKEGAHYTPEHIADFISDGLVKDLIPREQIRIVDPAVGDGELLLSLIRKIKERTTTRVHAYGYDINPEAIEITRERINGLYPDVEATIERRDFLEMCLEKARLLEGPSLFETDNIPTFDLLIANPPYIRTQVLGADQAQYLSRKFGLKGRVDIYQAFLVAMKAVLSKHSRAGVIVSNRFLSTKGSGAFRETLFRSYEIAGIWDFGDTRVFDAAVLPSVLFLKPDESPKNITVPFSSIYLTDRKGEYAIASNQVEALSFSGLVASNNVMYEVRHGQLVFDSIPSDVWRLQDKGSKTWLDQVESNTWKTFGEIGKARVGVKTTADNVFIRSDWLGEVGYEPELLRPLTTHHVAGRFSRSPKPLKKILYTHKLVNGRRKPQELDGFPLSREYLEEHREQLEGRSYVLKAKRKWYEIWVPQNPESWVREKLVFRDISERPTFWMDTEGTVVNGDCYWILRDDESAPKDILWLLLAIANSAFIEDFYDAKFQNKLYSNRRRFMTQYVEQFPVLDPSKKSSGDLIALAQKAYKCLNESEKVEIEAQIDTLVYRSFGVTPSH